MRSLVTVSRFLNGLRGLFMPLGLVALLAVGVHTAADLIDDRLLGLVELADAWLDGLWARWDLTQALVNRVDAHERTVIARSLALAWELSVDLVVCLPLFGYRDRAATLGPFERARVREAWARALHQPTPMRVLRPMETAIFAVAGAYGVERLVQATLYLGLLGDVAPAPVASVIARVLGGVAMVLVVLSLGWRAVLRAFEHADAVSSEAKNLAARLAVGLWASGLALPMALALLSQARALVSVVL